MKIFRHDPLPRVTPESRVTTYYFLQAMSVGAVNGFAGVWLASKGISEEQVGLIFATPVLVIVCIGLFVGRIADRADDWRQVIVVGAVASAIAPLGLYVADGFIGILVVWTFAVTTQMMILPVTDAAALRLSRRRGGDFGNLYAWKTIGYLSIVFLSGFILARFGIEAFLPLFVGLSIVRGLASLTLPNFRAQTDNENIHADSKGFIKSIDLKFSLPLIGWTLVGCTHSILNGFLGMLWHEQGLSPSTIGMLIGLSGIIETIMFFVFKRFISRFDARSLILVSCLAGVLRWGGFSFSPDVGVLVILQLLHALTYALGFLACTNFIANNTTEQVAAEAQSFFSILQAGTTIIALVGFGWLAGMFGAKAFLASAAFAAIGALVVAMPKSKRRAAQNE